MVSAFNWSRLVLGGLLVAGGYALWCVLKSPEKPEKAPEEDDEPVEETGFFSENADEQLKILFERIKKGDPCWDIQREARAIGRYEFVQELWIRLLEMHEDNAPEGLAVDDANFKEQLLYIIRDGLEPDCELLERMFKAYRTEPHDYTKMRVVRAVGRIGGEKARAFLEDVSNEGEGLAAEEAKRWLRR